MYVVLALIASFYNHLTIILYVSSYNSAAAKVTNLPLDNLIFEIFFLVPLAGVVQQPDPRASVLRRLAERWRLPLRGHGRRGLRDGLQREEGQRRR